MSSDLHISNEGMPLFERINQPSKSRTEESRSLPADTPVSSLSSEYGTMQRTESSAERAFSYHSNLPSPQFSASIPDSSILSSDLSKKLAKATEKMLQEQLETERTDKRFLQEKSNEQFLQALNNELEKNFREWVKTIQRNSH